MISNGRRPAINKNEISEIRRKLDPENCSGARIRGCYVNGNKEIISEFSCSSNLLPQEETEKYMAAFKKTLSGGLGTNLIDIQFSVKQVMESAEHSLLMELRESALDNDEAVQVFFERTIECAGLEGNYLIMLMCATCDLPYHPSDDMKLEDSSEDVFTYILCGVCPVKQSKPALSYFAQDKAFHAREQDWIVTAPELGFMFPAFDDRAANIYGALYYTRDTAEDRTAFVTGLFGSEPPMPAAEQRETFQSVLEESLAEDCKLEVVQAVHEQLRDMIEERKSDKEAGPLTVTPREVAPMLESCGVPQEKIEVFAEKYGEAFGDGAELGAANIIDAKRFEVSTPNVVIKVKPEYSDLVETRVLDGHRYILIRADEGVEVNGVSVSIADGRD